jgi:hypothetical protein
MVQARSELMKYAVNESNKLGSVNTVKAKEHMRQAFEYGLKTVRGKEQVLPGRFPLSRINYSLLT